MQKIRNKIYVIVFLFLCLINFYPQTKQSQDQSTKKHCVVKNTLTQTDSVSKVVYFQTEITIKEDTSHKSFVFIVGILKNNFYGVWFVSKEKPRSTYFSCLLNENCVVKIVDDMYMLESNSGRCLFFKKQTDSFYIPIKLHKQFRGVESIEHYIF